MSSRSLWGVGWMGPPGSAGGQSLGDGSWQWTLGQKALRRSAVDADVRTTTEQRGVRISRNWENEDSINTAGSEARSRSVKPEGDPDFPVHQLLSRWTPEEAPGECVTHLPSLSAQRWTPLR